MDEEIKKTVSHMMDAKCSLVKAAVQLLKVKPQHFDLTVKEVMETIGDISCAASVLEDFLKDAELVRGENDG